jgi:hypothetical protein
MKKIQFFQVVEDVIVEMQKSQEIFLAFSFGASGETRTLTLLAWAPKTHVSTIPPQRHIGTTSRIRTGDINRVKIAL